MKNDKTMYANYKLLGGGGLASMMVWITGVNVAQDLLVGVRRGFEAKKRKLRLYSITKYDKQRLSEKQNTYQVG